METAERTFLPTCFLDDMIGGYHGDEAGSLIKCFQLAAEEPGYTERRVVD